MSPRCMTDAPRFAPLFPLAPLHDPEIIGVVWLDGVTLDDFRDPSGGALHHPPRARAGQGEVGQAAITALRQSVGRMISMRG